ncbi:adenosylhomocysteinase-like [Neltuma alba]|uniref:adenosylhomocysteinase-like n=1 Tax=Neltuma alba TaxID=207710 RepID=UPI0010A53B61|nr:adenosylhomocysteinase-like [Prosopis alba]
MPGLMACRAKFGHIQPFKGARITISLHIVTQTAVFVETLTALGAEVRWCSGKSFSTDDHVAAAIARDSVSVFAWKGETLEEYWWCIERALDWGPGGGPDLIVDDGADATLFIVEGFKAEEIYAKTRQLPDPSSTDDAELQIVFSMLSDGLKTDPTRYHKIKDRLVGVSVKTTTGDDRLNQMQANGTLFFPAISVNQSVTKSKFINLLGRPYALLEVIMKATNTMISGKRAVVCGYDDASEEYAIALKQAGANVVVSELDPNHATQALLGGFEVNNTPEDADSEADIYVTPGFNNGNNNSVVVNHIKKMKNNTIIYNMDPILDPNRNIYAGVEQCFCGMKRTIINLETDKWVNPETNSSIIVLSNTGYPDLMPSWSCTSHVVAVLELWSKRGAGEHENKVYDLPNLLERKVSAFHLARLLDASMEPTNNVCAEAKIGDDIKRILKRMGVKACWLFGMCAMGFMKGATLKMSFAKVSIDLPAIWGLLKGERC